MKASHLLTPSEFVPKCPDDLLGPASTLAVGVMAHTMRVKPAQRGHLKVCFYGPPGTGKTTIANMVANSLANHSLDVERINGRNVTIDVVREWQHQAAYASMFGGWTVKLINEMDLIPLAAQELMLSYLDELKDRTAVIGTSNENTETLSERFKSRFQLAKVPPPDQEDIRKWLVKHWGVARTAAEWISISCCGNVREALLQAASYLQFGILPEEKRQSTHQVKDSSRASVAKKYWEEVRAGIRPAPGTAQASAA